MCDPASQHLNSKHSTYLTHFLVFAFPSKAYSEFPNILTGLLKEVMDNFASACEKGVVSQSGDTWYPACIGFKLDGMDGEGGFAYKILSKCWTCESDSLLP